MIVFVHIRDPNNAGDMASCPAGYFDFGPDVRMQNYSEPIEGAGLVVYGGGAMVNWLNGRTGLPGGPKVIWGAGSSRHGQTEPWPDPAGFELIGTREWTAEREAAGLYAPCASCLSPLFDGAYPITRAAVAFVNASESIRSRYPAIYGLDLPTMDNSASMAEIVAFLGSAETVVTNSYHACWFGLLLGRKVVCMPYSSKFYGFKYPIELSNGSDWKEKEKQAKTYSEALGESRASSIMFHRRVMEISNGT